MTTMKRMNEVLEEIKAAKQLQDELDAQIEALKAEAQEYLTDNEIDEYVNVETGTKCTWRETVSNRFDSTSFKKVHEDLYKAFCKVTSYKRFTLN